MLLPNHAYYQAVHGRWRGAFDFRITNRDAFERTVMGWLDRRSIASMATTKGLVMHTSVTYDHAKGIAVHTTRIVKWGLTLYDGIETFTLDPNGKDVSIVRDFRAFPSVTRTHEEGQSRAEVDASGKSAAYVFPFYGTTIRQNVAIEDEGKRVRVVQETAWCRGEQLLERVG